MPLACLFSGLFFSLLFFAPLSDANAAEKGVKTTAQDKCVNIRKKLNGREVVVNACEECKIVRVERQRPGGGVPNFRTLIVREKSIVDLPFKGPGRTRFVGADPCR